MLKKIKPYVLPYAVGISIPLLVGLLSAFLTRGNMNIYGEVNTPPLSPPAWLFPVAWSVLYVLMGISSAMVYLSRGESGAEAKRGLYYYALSLVFNFGWSIIFFNVESFLFAFIWLLFLLYFIIRYVICYAKVKPIAAYLQIPYVLWVAFAGYLNFGIYLLN